MEKQQTTTTNSGEKDTLWNEVTTPQPRKPKNNNTVTVNASA